MTTPPPAGPPPEGPVVVDTNIAGWLISRKPDVRPYEPYVLGRQLVVSFMTVAELRYGALKADGLSLVRRGSRTASPP